MTRPLTGQEREAFLAEPHVAVLSLPYDDERPPLAFPAWYAFLGGDRITYYTYRTEPRSRKLRLLREGSVLSLCVQCEDPPYKYVTVEGTVVDENGAPTAEERLAIIGRYLAEGDAQAYLDSEIASGVAIALFTIRADRWLGSTSARTRDNHGMGAGASDTTGTPRRGRGDRPMTTKARAEGDGTITKRADGRSAAAISAGWRIGPDGKPRRVRKWVYGKTRKDVADKLNAELGKQRVGLPIVVEKATVGEFLERWL